MTWWHEGDFTRPECRAIPNETPFNGDPNRIYQGYYSGMCFSFYGAINAGYYQVVRDIPAGSIVEASFMGHSWSCDEDGDAYSCGDPYGFYFRVGIDPDGGTDPFSSAIVWSDPHYLPDTYGQVGPVQATVVGAGAVTIFMQANGKWPNRHNDAYYDNPVLKIVSSGSNLFYKVPPTVAAVVPQDTATPLPDGTLVHTVVSGDTLFGIALAYGVDVEQVYELNGIKPGDFMTIGQELIISVSVATYTPTVTLTVTPTVTPTSTPETVATIAPEVSSEKDNDIETREPWIIINPPQICGSMLFTLMIVMMSTIVLSGRSLKL